MAYSFGTLILVRKKKKQFRCPSHGRSRLRFLVSLNKIAKEINDIYYGRA